jgi:single-stranded DNA-binding protein
LTADAVTRTVSGDKVVVGFRLAINDSYVSNNERVEVTNFVDCSYLVR